MAFNSYLLLRGKNQGDITGGVTQKGHKEAILVTAFNHEVLYPRDAVSGLPTGKRIHNCQLTIIDNKICLDLLVI